MTTTAETGALSGLEEAWRRSDRLFDLLEPEALLARPIPLRHPFIFYLGHLPAFAWNQLGRWLLQGDPIDRDLDELFARGIDPIGVDKYVPGRTDLWPPAGAVRAYRDRVRMALLEASRAIDPSSPHGALAVGTVIEHELMHQETLLYMARVLPPEQLRRDPQAPPYVYEAPAEPRLVEVPAGRTVLGRERDPLAFGWDNEFPAHEVDVPAFAIESTPVRNRDFLGFMEDAGYERRDLWTPEGWAWRERQRIWHPPFWRRDEDGHWLYRTLFEELPLERVLDWPVSVSWATAAAFARWRGGRLPTEPELHRAAYGTPGGSMRAHPWGDEAPSEVHGNFGFRHWSPTPVGHYPEGASAWGVLDLIGNGWEWTSTRFGPLPGFHPMPNYAGYSTDFFGEHHYVMLGASWATDVRLVRRSFRNWFQPFYPYTFSKFRSVFPV